MVQLHYKRIKGRNSMKPYLDYVYGEEIVNETGVATATSMETPPQRYRVIAVGEGHYLQTGELVPPRVKPGDIVIVQKHSEADTPDDLIQQGYGLFLASRIMAVEEKE